MAKKNKEVRAPLWRRILAYIIDMFIIAFTIMLPLTGSMRFQQQSSLNTFQKLYSLFTATNEFSWKLLFAGMSLAILAILYFAIFEYKLRQTIGKMIMRIEVHSSLQAFTFSQALLRNWTKFSTFLLFLDTIYMFFTASRLRCFEQLSKTKVILKPKAQLQRKWAS